MERHSQRENVLLGYGPKTPFKQSDIDFQDVFGGPPRRSSMQEMRYSLNSTNNSQGEEDSGLALRPWSGGGLNEMPVFGEETVNRRRYASDNFFDDIFRGDESVGSPRRSNQDSFGSVPGSRVMSPARPMLHRADPYSSSLPAQYQFSLPAKLTKAIDFPVSASSSRSPHTYKDPSSNAISSLYIPTTPVSRLSSEASQEEDDSKNEIRQSYRQSLLSHEFPLSSKELSHENKSGELEESTDIGSKLNKESKTAEAPNNNGQFHFSIYKWASRGLPVLMPVRGGNNTRSKERVKLERSSSSNGRIQSKNLAHGLETTYLPDSGLHLLKQGTNDESPYPEGMEQERALLFKTSTEDIFEEAVLSMAESKPVNKIPNIVKNVPGDTILNDRREEIRTRKGIHTSKEEAKKHELKSLRSLLSDNIDEKGNDEITSRKSEGKEAVEKTAAFGSNASVSKNAKKRDEKRIKPSRVARVNELQSPDLRKTSGDNLGKNEAKGKVKEFVQIFSQEAVSKPKIGSETRGQSFRSKSKGTFPADDEESANTAQTNETNHVHSVNKMIIPPNVSAVVDKSEKQSPVKTRVFNASENAFCQNDTSAASTESFRDGPKVTDVNVGDLFQDNFMVQELYNDQDKQPETGDDYEEIKISDAKIRKWLSGKEGNIRSLLSTLHYVLWAGSGWKPVPLMDIIEGSAVKRAYQKALLCLHPDKLQQKGAAAHQKYIAEKVFDVLQEAWDHFNSLGAM